LDSFDGSSSKGSHFPEHLIILFPNHSVEVTVVLVTEHYTDVVIVVGCIDVQGAVEVHAIKSGFTCESI
jgi:hypothetical protein